MAVDIGAEAINRPGGWANNATLINKDTPATIDGTITSIDIWVATNITGFRVGTFYVVSGDTLKCRASEAIAGTIVSDSKVTKAVSIAVQIGDYIGCFFSLGALDRHTSGYAGVWYITGNNVNPDVEANYGIAAGDAVSLGGYIGVGPITLVTRTYQYIWNVRSLVSDMLNLKWNVADTLDLVSKTLELQWNVRSLVNKSLQAMFNVGILGLVSRTLELQWNVRTLIDRAIQFKWNVRILASISLQHLRVEVMLWPKIDGTIFSNVEDSIKFQEARK